MEFKLNIRTDNAAFEDCPGFEVARILREIANKVDGRELPYYMQTIRDCNGNDVGRYSCKESN